VLVYRHDSFNISLIAPRHENCQTGVNASVYLLAEKLERFHLGSETLRAAAISNIARGSTAGMGREIVIAGNDGDDIRFVGLLDALGQVRPKGLW
jgi:hypothetical protein